MSDSSGDPSCDYFEHTLDEVHHAWDTNDTLGICGYEVFPVRRPDNNQEGCIFYLLQSGQTYVAGRNSVPSPRNDFIKLFIRWATAEDNVGTITGYVQQIIFVHYRSTVRSVAAVFESRNIRGRPRLSVTFYRVDGRQRKLVDPNNSLEENGVTDQTILVLHRPLCAPHAEMA